MLFDTEKERFLFVPWERFSMVPDRRQSERGTGNELVN